jgi:LacI family transcriptional regulator
MNKTVRLKAIADKLGVSVSTVSRVLNDKPGISQATRVLVLRELKLYKNQMAPALKTESPAGKFIGIIGRKRSEQVDSIYFHHSVNTFSTTFSDTGYKSLIINVNDEDLKSTSIQESLMTDECAGYILRGQSLSKQFIMSVIALGKPVVLLENKLEEHQADSVICDDFEGAKRSTEYLISKGHRHIAHITGPKEWYNNKERSRGYCQAMEDHGYLPILIHKSDTTIHTGAAALKTIREEHPEVTAVFAVDDAMALGLMNAAKGLGIDIPGSLAVAGFDDIPWSTMSYPPLTTSHIHIDKMGELAAMRILQLIKDSDSPHVEIKVPVELIVRESV